MERMSDETDYVMEQIISWYRSHKSEGLAFPRAVMRAGVKLNADLRLAYTTARDRLGRDPDFPSFEDLAPPGH